MATDINTNNLILNEMTETQLQSLVDSGTVPANQVFFTTDGTPTSSLPLGMIIPSAVVQENAGLHLLNGGALSTTGIYAEFCTWISNNTDKIKTFTETEYANQIETYGQCGGFVIGSDYVRIPTITKFIQGLSDISEIGNCELDTIREHTHDYVSYMYTGTNSNWGLKGSGVSGDTNTRETQTSASTGDDETKPKNVRYPYYMVVATVTRTDVEINLNNYANDISLINSTLPNKANLDASNVQQNSYANLSFPVYSSKLGFTNGTTYTAPCDGYIYNHTTPRSTHYLTTYIDGLIFEEYSYDSNAYNAHTHMLPIAKGSSFYTTNTSSARYFIPCRGAVLSGEWTGTLPTA